MSRGRLAIVYPHANVDSVPCLVGAAEALGRAGYDVDLLVLTRAGGAPPAFASPRVRVRSLGTERAGQPPTALRVAARRLRFLPPSARAPLARCYALAAAGLARGSRLVAGAAPAPSTTERYDCVIGVDADGLQLAAQLAAGAPIGYFSLELLLSYELQTQAERCLKATERMLSREAAFVVIQDAARGRLLAEDNAIPLERMLFVPNSPPGPARRLPSRYWHQRFGLPEQARVVLHAGSLGAWTGIEDLVASVPDWPEPWFLVIHTRYDAEASPYVERLQAQADSRRVRFSLKPVPRQEYDTLIDGADVGACLYVPSRESAFTQQNIQTIGLSSGKLAYFVRAGVPVIVNQATSVAAQVEQAGCGVAVSSARAVPDALGRLASDYAHYAARACAFFDRELDFERAFEPVIARLEQLGVAA